jgi:uncharacterized protein YndB with AHSA1/START domain
MWKWLSGCLLLVIVLVAFGLWRGYRTMSSSLSPDGSVRVTIAAPPARVFASLADGDSVATWMAQGSIVKSSRHGRFVPGDSVRVETRTMIGVPKTHLTWRVSEVVPDRLVAWQLIPDTTARVVAIRRDSLVALGDSTIVISKVIAPKLDSLRKSQATSSDSAANGFARIGSDLLINVIRMQPKLELTRLKGRIEKKE